MGHGRPLSKLAGAPDSLTAKAPNTRIGTCAGPEAGDAGHAKMMSHGNTCGNRDGRRQHAETLLLRNKNALYIIA